MAENAPHLVAALEHSPEPTDILVETNQPRFVEEFLEILSKRYGTKVHYYEPQGYTVVTSPIVIIEDVIKRHYGNFPQNLAQQIARISAEAGELRNGYTSVNSMTPIFGQHVSPRRWELKSAEGILSTKNRSILILPSKTSVQLLRNLINTSYPTGNIPRSDKPPLVGIISRKGETSRGRDIGNEERLLEAIPGSCRIKFSGMSLVEQIRIAQKLDILIGVHGSGLTNMIYMRKSARVIEISPAKESVPAADLLESLAHLCDQKYSRVYASSLNEIGECLLSPQAIEQIRVLSTNP